MQASLLNFSLDEGQWQRDWTLLLSLASQPGIKFQIQTTVIDSLM